MHIIDILLPRYLLSIFRGKQEIQLFYSCSLDEFINDLNRNNSNLLISLNESNRTIKIEVEIKNNIFVNGYQTFFEGEIALSESNFALKGKFHYFLITKIYTLTMLAFITAISFITQEGIIVCIVGFILVQFLNFSIKLISVTTKDSELIIITALKAVRKCQRQSLSSTLGNTRAESR